MTENNGTHDRHGPNVRVHPPIIYAISILSGIGLNNLWPLPMPFGLHGRLYGGIIIVIASLIAAWALLHFLRAAEHDFGDILAKKNALVSLQQIIRELEGTQDFVWSPLILNGTGFGLVANHSLVMASYISRANAAIVDLRDLLSQG